MAISQSKQRKSKKVLPEARISGSGNNIVDERSTTGSDLQVGKKPFYERNDHVINNLDVNVYFEDLLAMTPKEFEEWVIKMRKAILNSWDTYGCPPRTGKDEADIIDQFNQLGQYPVHEFTHSDELSTIGDDVIINKSRIGVEVDQWFSNMFKTRINYSANDTGYSIYDMFADDKYLPRMIRGTMRHLRRDSFYKHALSTIKHDKKYSVVDVASGDEWMEAFFGNPSVFTGYDFMLEQVAPREGASSSYFQLEQSNILQLTKEQFEKWKPNMSYRHYSTFDHENLPDDQLYAIRLYKKGERVFPAGFASFRIGYIQPAVNFPPMTAKYLYERFTEHCKNQDRIVIYDPSSGWGGRILGAMSVRDDRNIHYVGTDPNPENWQCNGYPSKYHAIADFYNTKTYRANPFFSSVNSFDLYQLGSEVISENNSFQQYEGKVDLVFTSPPYFNREAYSEDENQSYKKFSSYDSWRDGFLRPTLETCVKYLKNDRYLLWNIADLLVSGDYLPLEEDSRKILESLGMEYKYTLKMALENMPGQNRVGEDGLPKCKNYCKVNNRFHKYEPVFVFYKP